MSGFPRGFKSSYRPAVCLALAWLTVVQSCFADDRGIRGTVNPQPGSREGTLTSPGGLGPGGNAALQMEFNPPATEGDLPPLKESHIFKPKELPPESHATHDENKTLDMGPFHMNAMIRISTLHPMKLEASYNEPLTLKDALIYTLRNSLPIRISHESLKYQRDQLASALISALPIPSFSTAYNLTNSNIINTGTTSHSTVWQTTLRYPVFSGGSAFYGFLGQLYREQGWKQAFYSSINDAMLDVYQKYMNLVLQNALLQIRAKSLEVSQEQLKLNNSQYMSGVGTRYAIMQSRTQLATDRQAMLAQQVAVRQAALALAFAMNIPMAINLVPEQETITEQALVNATMPINDLLAVALLNRPELRQYEMFRLAAARNVQVAASSLYPNVSFFTSYTHADTVVNPPNGNVNGVANAQIASSSNQTGTANNNSLGQTASFSPTGSTTANTGANNIANTQIVAASGGQPLNLVQSGSLVTSGASAPSIAGGNGSGSSTGFSTSNVNGSNTAGAGVFGGNFNTWQAGFSLSWSLSSMGLTSVANIVSARALARQAHLQANQELLLVTEQVRSDYLAALTAREQIDNAAEGADSAREAMRLAELRARAGTGTTYDLILSQRDYINALTLQAQAIIASNLAQAQLLHDLGVISVDTLTHGFHADQISMKKPVKPQKL